MRSVRLIVPGSIHTRTGGSIYDRRIAEGLRDRGWTVDVREATRVDACLLEDLPTGRLVLVDGLLFTDVVEAAAEHASRLKVIALIHLPLAETPGLTADRRSELETRERRALASARAVVVTGRGAADTARRYGVPDAGITVAEPGVDRAPAARGSAADRVELLCVATVNAAKGHDVLVRALSSLRQRPWHLTCAGSLERDAATAARLRALIAALGVSDRVSLCGELDDAQLARQYDAADVFVLASLHETYGMAVAEALARGLPVVTTTTGAATQIVGTSAGILVPPGDEGALAAALQSVIGDRRLRARLADGARAVRDMLPTWDRTVDTIERVLTDLDGHGAVAF
jgi:glycosyltransferase involved in cell wall biosynthesis